MAVEQLLSFDLAGWRMAGPGGFRLLPDGAVESYGGSGLFWYSAEVFQDFALSVQWRISRPEDNSGVFLRSPPLSDSPQPAIERGYEVQIDDRGFDPERRVFDSALHLTGAIYKLAPAIQRCSRPVGAWNLFEIAARGAILAVRVQRHRGLPSGKCRTPAAWPCRAAEPSRRIGGPVSPAADQFSA